MANRVGVGGRDETGGDDIRIRQYQAYIVKCSIMCFLFIKGYSLDIKLLIQMTDTNQMCGLG